MNKFAEDILIRANQKLASMQDPEMIKQADIFRRVLESAADLSDVAGNKLNSLGHKAVAGLFSPEIPGMPFLRDSLNSAATRMGMGDLMEALKRFDINATAGVKTLGHNAVDYITPYIKKENKAGKLLGGLPESTFSLPSRPSTAKLSTGPKVIDIEAILSKIRRNNKH